MSQEIITINVGGTGVNISPHIWENYYQQYDIDTNGKYEQSVLKGSYNHNHQIHNFFEERKDNGSFIPRNISLDLDPDSFTKMDETPHIKLFNTNYFIKSNTETHSSNLFPYGFQTKLIDKFNDILRKSVEKCNNFQGIIINHSMVGGTGSGTTAKILNQFTNDYKKKTKITFSVLHEQGWDNNNWQNRSSPLFPYNGLLTLHHNINDCDMSITMDNNQLNFYMFRHCVRSTVSRRYKYANEIIVRSQMMFTHPFRYKDSYYKTKDINSLANMVNIHCPSPRLHFCFSSSTPMTPNPFNCRSWGRKNDNTACSPGDPQYFSIRSPDYDGEEDKFIGLSLCYFGEIDTQILCNGYVYNVIYLDVNRTQIVNRIYGDVMQVIYMFYDNKAMDYNYRKELENNKYRLTWIADCDPVVNITSKRALNKYDPKFNGYDCCSAQLKSEEQEKFMIGNNFCIARLFKERIHIKYSLLFQSKSYLHWYIAEGMEEDEFREADENFITLEKEYLDTLLEYDSDD